MPKLTLFVREDSYFVAVSQKLCNICIRIYINHKRHITENNDGYVTYCFCKAVFSRFFFAEKTLKTTVLSDKILYEKVVTKQ